MATPQGISLGASQHGHDDGDLVPAIRPARPDEIPEVGRLIAVSFNDLAPNAYLVPPLSERVDVMADFFTLMTSYAQAQGRVDVVALDSGMVAAAVWFDVTQQPLEPADYEERLAELAGPYRPNFDALDELFSKHHPHDPHWHLAFLAVLPGYQHHRLGSALMRRTYEELDRAEVPTFLEATNEQNIRLYRRHGYADMDPFVIRLPDGAPFYRMWRPVRGAASD